MSDDANAQSADLEAAIAENPEAVAAFVRRLDAVNELLDVLALGDGALTDEMARDLASTGATLAESADAAATEEVVTLAETVGENGDELAGALESLLVLERTGALEELVEIAGVASLGTAALDDEMVRTLAATGTDLGELAQTAATDDVHGGLTTLLEGLGSAEDADPGRVGPLGLIRASRDPAVQYGLGYLLSLAAAIGRAQASEGTKEGR